MKTAFSRRVSLSIAFVAVNLMACCCGGVAPQNANPNQGAVAQNDAVANKVDSDEAANMGNPAETPDNVSYSIIKNEKHVNAKGVVVRRIEVRLNKRVSEEVLRAIGLKVRSEQNPKPDDRTFISYVIADAEYYWATTNFDPPLKPFKLEIRGLTVDQEKNLGILPDDPTREVIGCWLDEELHKCRITIYRRNGRTFVERTWRDGSGVAPQTFEVIEKAFAAGKRFDPIQYENPEVTLKKTLTYPNEYWVIDQSGNLQFRIDTESPPYARTLKAFAEKKANAQKEK